MGLKALGRRLIVKPFKNEEEVKGVLLAKQSKLSSVATEEYTAFWGFVNNN